MKILATSAAVLALAATGAFAQSVDTLPAGDGWSQQVISQYFPSLAEEAQFRLVDVDSDNEVSRNELQAAIDRGDLPAKDG